MSSEFKGTPGPWEVEDNGHFYDINAARGTVGNVCSSRSWFDNHEHRGPVAMANAQLIASAPRLLEVAISLLDALESENPLSHSDTINLARAEIAKALGESQ